ncbi:hypothetical protein FCM35_KLT22087 [Carex littledalei]|uniref:Uncharacterized protein n=1 Tax=Carex littledalei TaxID=544730 RepID=A0A833Q6X3_9POAL|nr:hypothetical protein FCM35_KLT22087 [Carex littledalei]
MLLVRGSNKAPCRYGARGDVRSSPPLAAPGHARRPHTWAHRTSRFGGPMSASFCPEATERGWASNAREAGVPSGGSLGRNLRSKTRWFTGFCNHTTYRISLRSSSMREPRYPLPRVILFFRRPRQPAPHGATRRRLSSFSCSLATSRAVFRPAAIAPGGREGRGRRGPRRRRAPPGQQSVTRATVVFFERQRQ